MTASKNTEIWVVMRVDSLADASEVPAVVMTSIENQRRSVRAGDNDFASAMRQVEQELY